MHLIAALGWQGAVKTHQKSWAGAARTGFWVLLWQMMGQRGSCRINHCAATSKPGISAAEGFTGCMSTEMCRVIWSSTDLAQDNFRTNSNPRELQSSQDIVCHRFWKGTISRLKESRNLQILNISSCFYNFDHSYFTLQDNVYPSL